MRTSPEELEALRLGKKFQNTAGVNKGIKIGLLALMYAILFISTEKPNYKVLAKRYAKACLENEKDQIAWCYALGMFTYAILSKR